MLIPRMRKPCTTTHDGVIIRGFDVAILANMTNDNLTTYAINFDLGNNIGSLVIGAKNTLLDGVVNQSTNVQSRDINTTRIGASVHYVAVDTAVATENLKEAIEAANQARKDLATAKDDIKAGRLRADAIKDYEANLVIATANIANAKIALGSTAASAAATAPTLGFSAKLGANHTQSQSQQTQANQDFIGTSIKAANVTFIGNDLTAKGLQGDISKLNVDHLNKLTLTHGTTTNTTKSQSNTNTLDASISTSGNMAVGMGRQQSHEGSTSTIAHDTKLNVGELNGYAKETILHGATIVAQGGNIGIGANNLNLGYNQQNSQSDIITNNTPSGIIYITTDKIGDKHSETHSLTAKHTSLTGGVIAAIHQDKDGNQTNDKLNFTTNTLATQDLLATESTQSKDFGANLGLQSKEGSIKVSSIGLSANRNGSDKQTLALATIGQGATINHTITHNGQAQNATDLAQTAINTDATNTSKVIKDIKTGGLDINTTIDGRVFSKAGREEIKRE